MIALVHSEIVSQIPTLNNTWLDSMPIQMCRVGVYIYIYIYIYLFVTYSLRVRYLLSVGHMRILLHDVSLERCKITHDSDL